MLRSLYIQNYALIEKLDISFSSGFSVITGETGAGKSIILGAIGLLLGQRADVKAIRVGASKCIIEARFDISAYGMQPFFEENELEYEEECILRREVSASGKSRAFINDTPASLAQMKELGEQLIDVHSQHQNLLLNKEGFQLNVLDILSHNEEALSAYQHIFGAWKQAQQDLEALVARANQDKSDEDYIRFQLEQLEEAHLSAGRYAGPCGRDTGRTLSGRADALLGRRRLVVRAEGMPEHDARPAEGLSGCRGTCRTHGKHLYRVEGYFAGSVG